MATITSNMFSGGANITPNDSAGVPSLATVLQDVADDLTAIRTALTGAAAKLDADTGVTDTDYAANLNTALGTQKTINGG